MSDQAMMKEPMVMMAVEHYASYRWVQAPVAALALWLISSPFTFGYRSRALIWSDIVSGALTLAMAFAALGRRRGLVSWLIAAIGLWLLFAPLLFWAPQASAYANDTLVGALLIAFAFIIPMGMTMKGAEVPPGWSYNPSSWPQRLPATVVCIPDRLARLLTSSSPGGRGSLRPGLDLLSRALGVLPSRARCL